jgi:hypothetical protein
MTGLVPAYDTNRTSGTIVVANNATALITNNNAAMQQALVPKVTANSASGMVEAVVQGILSFPIVHPDIMLGFGKNDIHTYRARFTNVLRNNNIPSAVAMMTIQLTMATKNYTRLKSGFAALPTGISSNVVVKQTMQFINTHCCAKTDKAGAKMPTVKIPDSFPEICSLVHAQGLYVYLQGRDISADELAKQTVILVKKLWFASIAMDPTLQDLNKTATKEEWDRWGTSPGVKSNSKGETIQFDEEIYVNQANDKIPLINMDGTIFVIPSGGYTLDDVLEWLSNVLVAMSRAGVHVVA